MNLKEIKQSKYCLTHAGTFHADDVFSAAFLKLINPSIKVMRVAKMPNDFTGIAFDIGDGEFDHHNVNKLLRNNGIPYASFGKLWKSFAKELYGDYVYEKLDRLLIEKLDLSDNTGCDDSLSLAISTFNPIDKNETGDKEFASAVNFAKKILKNLILKEKENEIEEGKIKTIYKNSLDKRIIVLNESLYFKDYLPDTDAIYVIYPSKRGGYLAQGVTKNKDTLELKKSFPKEWLQSLPSCITFCHSSGFLIAADNLEDIKEACRMALEDY